MSGGEIIGVTAEREIAEVYAGGAGGFIPLVSRPGRIINDPDIAVNIIEISLSNFDQAVTKGNDIISTFAVPESKMYVFDTEIDINNFS